MLQKQLLKALPVHIHLMCDFRTGMCQLDDKVLEICVFDPSDGLNTYIRTFKWGYAGTPPVLMAAAILQRYVDSVAAARYKSDLALGYIAGLPQRDLNVHVNLRWVMSIILHDGPFVAVKRTVHATS